MHLGVWAYDRGLQAAEMTWFRLRDYEARVSSLYP